MTKFQTKKHGYNDDELKSALQKSIRRGLEESAMYYALELAYEGKSSFGWLRNRLKIIAYEDIGLANPEVVLQVSKAVEDMDYFYNNKNDEWILALSHIILLLCRSKKSRINDHFVINMDFIWNSTAFDIKETFKIPDYALDKHTTKGCQMGRGNEHFIEEGDKLENEEEELNDYKERYHKILKNKK